MCDSAPRPHLRPLPPQVPRPEADDAHHGQGGPGPPLLHRRRQLGRAAPPHARADCLCASDRPPPVMDADGDGEAEADECRGEAGRKEPTLTLGSLRRSGRSQVASLKNYTRARVKSRAPRGWRAHASRVGCTAAVTRGPPFTCTALHAVRPSRALHVTCTARLATSRSSGAVVYRRRKRGGAAARHERGGPSGSALLLADLARPPSSIPGRRRPARPGG